MIHTRVLFCLLGQKLRQTSRMLTAETGMWNFEQLTLSAGHVFFCVEKGQLRKVPTPLGSQFFRTVGFPGGCQLAPKECQRRKQRRTLFIWLTCSLVVFLACSFQNAKGWLLQGVRKTIRSMKYTS